MKKEFGQFYTTNYEYILENIKIPETVFNIIEPFVGKGDLLKFIQDKQKYFIETYDIEPKYNEAVKRDTLLNPPCYTNKFVITNPPYLARNKNNNKEIYNKYKCNDLYKCFISCIIDNPCLGGILVIPLNFISSIRKADIELRKRFLKLYKICLMNIFEERVFEDTSCSVCSFLFILCEEPDHLVKTVIFPSRNQITFSLNEDNNYTIGGEIYNLPSQNKVQRATKNNTKNMTNIVLKCIDDTTPIGFSITHSPEKYIDNTKDLSCRSYALLTITTGKEMIITEQTELVKKMNCYINQKREKYASLFLTNYREFKRKRISFELAFKICNHVINSIELKE